MCSVTSSGERAISAPRRHRFPPMRLCRLGSSPRASSAAGRSLVPRTAHPRHGLQPHVGRRFSETTLGRCDPWVVTPGLEGSGRRELSLGHATQKCLSRLPQDRQRQSVDLGRGRLHPAFVPPETYAITTRTRPSQPTRPTYPLSGSASRACSRGRRRVPQGRAT